MIGACNKAAEVTGTQSVKLVTKALQDHSFSLNLHASMHVDVLSYYMTLCSSR